MSARWIVQRAGAPSGDGYLRGWLAMDVNGIGFYRPTWREAMELATAEADDAFARELRRAAVIAELHTATAGARRLVEIADRTYARLVAGDITTADHRTDSIR